MDARVDKVYLQLIGNLKSYMSAKRQHMLFKNSRKAGINIAEKESEFIFCGDFLLLQILKTNFFTFMPSFAFNEKVVEI